MRELKKYKLRKARKPMKHDLLSGVVHVVDREGVDCAYIAFSEDFVDAVGKALPYGLSKGHPGYLKFLHMPGRKTWRLFAYYLTEFRGTLLWETPHLPPWISRITID